MRLILSVIALLTTAACADETLSGYAAAPGPWRLTEMNGAPMPQGITLTFEAGGKFSGQAPCNRYFGQTTVPYPWFEAGPIGATRRACPQLDLETRYLSNLAKVTLAEVAGPVLILSDGSGLELAFDLGPRK